MNRFEKLIEYVINDEEQKARELFHDIVVEKSRQIYENLMAEEAEEELDESEEELDEAESCDEELDEGTMGGDAADDLIDDVEMEEESDINMEAEDDEEVEGEEEFEIGGEEEFGDEEGSDEAATKDDILNLEDKLDELMAEFEALMGGDEDLGGDEEFGDGDDFGADEGGDAIATDDTEEMLPMAEAISLKAAPKPTTSEEGSVNKKSPTTFNSGATGMAASPVKPTGTEAKGRPNPTTKDLGVAGPQDAGKGAFKTAAPKPVTSQASGVNTRSPLAKG
jgi:hypothetical protein